MTWTIHNEDTIKWANEYDGEPFHALLSDPPYHLTSIVKRFGKSGSAPAKFGTDGVFSRSSKGFMGQQWDGGDIAFQPETWYAFMKVLYPGAFGMAFSASRNWHRLAVAIEDAGFVIHPSIFGWLQGQGFPKATNIDKQIDRLVGAERKDGKLRTDGRGRDPLKTSLRRHGDTGIGHADGSHQIYTESLPESELAKEWQGHRYGLQALKPAVEPIIVFQKPYEGRPIDNIVTTGAGALNIELGRIPVNGEGVVINRFTDGAKPWGNGSGHEYETEITSQGRYPANFVLDEELAERLDNQSGFSKSTVGSPRGTYKKGMFANSEFNKVGMEHEDSGGASRFFFQVSNQIDEADPIYYTAKVNSKERNAGLEEQCKHPTLKPISLSKYLATLLLPPNEYSPRRLFVPFSGVASEMIGAFLSGWEEVVGVEFDTENNYVGIAKKRLEHWLK